MNTAPLFGAALAGSTVIAAYAIGYRSGLQSGRSTGFDEGLKEGRKEGAKRGFAVGFDRGKRALSEDEEAPDEELEEVPASRSGWQWWGLLVAAGAAFLFASLRSAR